MGKSWKQYSKNKPIADIIKEIGGQGAQSKNFINVDAVEITKRAIFIGENMVTFSSAASEKVYRRLTSQYHHEMHKRYSYGAPPSTGRVVLSCTEKC